MRNGLGGAGGVEIELARAIRERASFLLKDLLLETDVPGEAPRSPTIVNGYLPPKRAKDGSEVPFVIVRPNAGKTDTTGFTRVTVKLIIVAYSEAFDGHEYAMLVLQRLRIGLMEQPTLDQRYRMELPFTWDLFDDQPYPNWQLVITTEWTVPTPQEIPDEGVY